MGGKDEREEEEEKEEGGKVKVRERETDEMRVEERGDGGHQKKSGKIYMAPNMAAMRVSSACATSIGCEGHVSSDQDHEPNPPLSTFCTHRYEP
jgi:hypothetical protein